MSKGTSPIAKAKWPSNEGRQRPARQLLNFVSGCRLRVHGWPIGMPVTFLLDENVPGRIWRAIQRHNEDSVDLDVVRVGQPDDLPLAQMIGRSSCGRNDKAEF